MLPRYVHVLLFMFVAVKTKDLANKQPVTGLANFAIGKFSTQENVSDVQLLDIVDAQVSLENGLSVYELDLDLKMCRPRYACSTVTCSMVIRVNQNNIMTLESYECVL
jgi:hypothetical protein